MKIRLKNFRCYEDRTFEFGDSGLVLISAPSGEGKSTILMGIHFALFGVGTKLVSYGKTSCLVELYFDDLKVVRTKRPNRLVVNDVYEDKSGQAIIDERFGDTFNTTGYISQNALNSFVLMSPIEKLGFLEKFSFKDVNLGAIKGRCKALISKRHDSLIRATSKLEMAIKMRDEVDLGEGEGGEFPLKSSTGKKVGEKNREKVEKNERTRLKNCGVTRRKEEREMRELEKRLADLRVRNVEIKGVRERLEEIGKREAEIREERNGVKEVLREEKGERVDYERVLERVLTRRELTRLSVKLRDDREKMERMKREEDRERGEEIRELRDKVGELDTRESLEEEIEGLREMVKDYKRIKELRNGVVVRKEEEECKTELERKRGKVEEYGKRIKEKGETLSSLKLQRELLQCPSCDANLRLKEGKLLEESDFSEESVRGVKESVSELREKIREMEDEREKEVKRVAGLERKLEKSKEAKKAIKEIEDEWESGIDSDCEESLESKREEITELKRLEKRLRGVEGKGYSSTLEQVIKDVEKLDARVMELKGGEGGEEGEGENEVSMSEEELREKVQEVRKARETERRLGEESRKLGKRSSELNERLVELGEREDESSKVSEVSEEELEKSIKRKEESIERLKEKEETHTSNLERVEEWKKWKEKRDEWKRRDERCKELKKDEKECMDRYASSTLLKEKILEAESIALLNVISSINTHAQIYIDAFFQDNPISVTLSPFKKGKKSGKDGKISKPQVNIEIEYKGMECDLNMLSGGELSRIVLAFTLALCEMFNTPLLLLDECTSSLDQEMTSVVFNGIKEHFSGKMVLVIAHQVITGAFDRAILLREE